MAVPTAITDLSVTAASNSPAGSDAIGTTLDDFLRSHGAFIAQLYTASQGRNKVINGGFEIAQRGTSFTAGTNSDDMYTLDRWYLLSDGNDIVDVTQESTTVPTNGHRAIALDVETANKKFGIAQIIEGANCAGLIGNTVTLSFKAKVSATTKLDNVKAAIIAWSGTEDTVTSDIVSAWEVEGTRPTLIANATYENTPANLNLTTSYATYTISAAVDTASTKNIILFIWSDVTDTTAGDFLYIADVQLEAGSVRSPFESRIIETELAMCQRYYYRKSLGTVGAIFAVANNISTTQAVGYIDFPVTMRAAPTLEQNGTAGDYGVQHAATSTACSAVITISAATIYGSRLVATVAAGLTAGQGSSIRSQANTPYIGWTAEL